MLVFQMQNEDEGEGALLCYQERLKASSKAFCVLDGISHRKEAIEDLHVDMSAQVFLHHRTASRRMGDTFAETDKSPEAHPATVLYRNARRRPGIRELMQSHRQAAAFTGRNGEPSLPAKSGELERIVVCNWMQRDRKKVQNATGYALAW